MTIRFSSSAIAANSGMAGGSFFSAGFTRFLTLIRLSSLLENGIQSESKLHRRE